MRLVRRLTFVLFLGGCAHGPQFAEPIKPITDHPRVVYRSLVPEESLSVETCPAPGPPPARVGEPVFIPFPPDRWTLRHDDTRWRDVYQALDRAAQYAVVGWARPDEAGAALVAQRRASVIAGLLVKDGFPAGQLHLYTSWSGGMDRRAPVQGVVIVQIPADRGLWGMPQAAHYSSQATNEGRSREY